MPHKDPVKRKEYHRQYHAEWYAENKEMRNRQTAEYYKKDRLYWNLWNRWDSRNVKYEVMSHYSKSETPFCACCGEEEIRFLTMDHIDNNGAQHRRDDPSAGSICGWLRSHDFPEGFQVLCWNCNEAKAHFGECPHRAEFREDCNEIYGC